MESSVTLAITETEYIANRQTDRQTFFFIYILAEVPDAAQENLILHGSVELKNSI